MARKKSVRRSEVLSPSLTHPFISTWNTKMNQHDQYHKIHWIIGGPYHHRKPTHTHITVQMTQNHLRYVYIYIYQKYTNDPKPSKTHINPQENRKNQSPKSNRTGLPTHFFSGARATSHQPERWQILFWKPHSLIRPQGPLDHGWASNPYGWFYMLLWHCSNITGA